MLLEKAERLGGNAWNITATAKGEAVRPWLEGLIAKVNQHANIKVLTNAHLKTAGRFRGQLRQRRRGRTGKSSPSLMARPFWPRAPGESRPDEYLYGQDPRVMTQLEMDTRLNEQPSEVAKLGSVAFIQCVGSRNTQRPYCSRICCTHTVKSAIRLKELNPRMNVYVLFRDLRTYGKREELYKKARDLGVLFIRYTLDSKPRVSANGRGLTVACSDPILQMPLELKVDHLVLAAAVEPNPTHDLVALFKCGFNADGFLTEAHPKLRPVDMSVDGLFICGMCNYPQPIEESLAQAQAAVSRACVVLAKKEMQLDAIKSAVTEKCDGCALCLDVCPYRALKLVEENGNGQRHRKIASDPALCKGCGLCAATCPKGGIYVHGFTLDQLRAQVVAAWRPMH